MALLGNISIRQKLVLVIMSICALGLMLTSSTSILYEFLSYKKEIVRDLHTQAEIIGANSSAALAFRDREAAREILSALHARTEVVYACLFSLDAKVFAEYGSTTPPLQAEAEGHRFEKGHLILFHPISLEGDRVGTIVLKASMAEQEARLRHHAGIALVVMVAAMLMALFLSTGLQSVISGPILDLTTVTRAVTQTKDYSLRAHKRSADEIGELTDGFNEMLDQIQSRDEALRTSEEQFRQLAETIREVFWVTDATKEEMIYVSPAYEQIWGRTPESLYESPKSWAEAIHPDDHKRVLNALAKQVDGSYDEEYRIRKPDGSIRWIHDRAFPVQDDTGRVIRIVGIAEDITQRRQAEEAFRLQCQIVDNMQEGVVLTRASDARIVYTNPKFESMFGYGPGELKGKPISIVNAPTDRTPDETAQLIMASLRESGTWHGEVCNRKKDSSTFWCFANVSIFEHLDHSQLWISVHTDVTDLKRLEKQILEISDREQQRIGQDLHDGLCQHLVATGYAASLLGEKLSDKKLKETADATEIASLINEAVSQARTIARVLYPIRLESDGLSSALQEMAFSTEALWGISCRFEADSSVAIEDTPTATHLYRIAQEAMANAVKHAKPKNILVGLRGANGSTILTISDDGVGIADSANRNKGMGLHIMRYRARMIGANLTIANAPGGGTIVSCYCPKTRQPFPTDFP